MARDSVDISPLEIKELLYDLATNVDSNVSVMLTDSVYVHNITGIPHYCINFTMHASSIWWDGTGFKTSPLEVLRRIAIKNGHLSIDDTRS